VNHKWRQQCRRDGTASRATTNARAGPRHAEHSGFARARPRLLPARAVTYLLPPWHAAAARPVVMDLMAWASTSSERWRAARQGELLQLTAWHSAARSAAVDFKALWAVATCQSAPAPRAARPTRACMHRYSDCGARQGVLRARQLLLGLGGAKQQ
jgi:hypothetical protein